MMPLPFTLQQLREANPDAAYMSDQELLHALWEDQYNNEVSQEDFFKNVAPNLAMARRRRESPDRSALGEFGTAVLRGVAGTTVGSVLELSDLATRTTGIESLEGLSSGALNAFNAMLDDPHLRASFEAEHGKLNNVSKLLSLAGQGAGSMAGIWTGGLATVASKNMLKGVGKKVAKAKLKAKLKAKAKQKAVKENISDMSKTFNQGAKLTAAGMMAGEAAGDMRQTMGRTGEEIPLLQQWATTLAYGTIAGKLESLVPGMVLGKPLSAMAGKEIAKEATDGFFKGLARSGATGSLSEGATEVAQGALLNAFAKYGYDVNREILEGAAENFIAGALAGGGMGTVSGGVAGLVDSRDPLRKELDKKTGSKSDLSTEATDELNKELQERGIGTSQEQPLEVVNEQQPINVLVDDEYLDNLVADTDASYGVGISQPSDTLETAEVPVTSEGSAEVPVTSEGSAEVPVTSEGSLDKATLKADIEREFKAASARKKIREFQQQAKRIITGNFNTYQEAKDLLGSTLAKAGVANEKVFNNLKKREIANGEAQEEKQPPSKVEEEAETKEPVSQEPVAGAIDKEQDGNVGKVQGDVKGSQLLQEVLDNKTLKPNQKLNAFKKLKLGEEDISKTQDAELVKLRELAAAEGKAATAEKNKPPVKKPGIFGEIIAEDLDDVDVGDGAVVGKKESLPKKSKTGGLTKAQEIVKKHGNWGAITKAYNGDLLQMAKDGLPTIQAYNKVKTSLKNVKAPGKGNKTQFKPFKPKGEVSQEALERKAGVDNSVKGRIKQSVLQEVKQAKASGKQVDSEHFLKRVKDVLEDPEFQASASGVDTAEKREKLLDYTREALAKATKPMNQPAKLGTGKWIKQSVADVIKKLRKPYKSKKKLGEIPDVPVANIISRMVDSLALDRLSDESVLALTPAKALEAVRGSMSAGDIQAMFDRATELFQDFETELEIALRNKNFDASEILELLEGRHRVYEVASGQEALKTTASAIPWTKELQKELAAILKKPFEQIDFPRLMTLQQIERYHTKPKRKKDSWKKYLENRIRRTKQRIENNLKEAKFYIKNEPRKIEEIRALRAERIMLANLNDQRQDAIDGIVPPVVMEEIANIRDEDQYGGLLAFYTTVYKRISEDEAAVDWDVFAAEGGRVRSSIEAFGPMTPFLTGDTRKALKKYIEQRLSGETGYKLGELRAMAPLTSYASNEFWLATGKEDFTKRTEAPTRPQLPQGMPDSTRLNVTDADYWVHNGRFRNDTLNDFMENTRYDSDNYEDRAAFDEYLREAAEIQAHEKAKTTKSPLAKWLGNPRNRKAYADYLEAVEKYNERLRKRKRQPSAKDKVEEELTRGNEETQTGIDTDIGIEAGVGDFDAGAIKRSQQLVARPQSAGDRLRALQRDHSQKVIDLAASALVNKRVGRKNLKSEQLALDKLWKIDRKAIEYRADQIATAGATAEAKSIRHSMENKDLLDVMYGQMEYGPVTLASVLETIEKLKTTGAPISKQMQTVLNGLSDFGDAADLALINVRLADPTSRSFFNPMENTIGIQPDGNLYVLAHEVIHALTYKAIAAGRPGTVTLQRAFDLAKNFALNTKNSFADRLYGMSNLHEFAAELLINPSLQEFLASVPDPQAPKKTMWSRIVGAFHRLLFGTSSKPGDTALTTAMTATIQLVAEPSPNIDKVSDVFLAPPVNDFNLDLQIAELAMSKGVSEEEMREQVNNPAVSSTAKVSEAWADNVASAELGESQQEFVDRKFKENEENVKRRKLQSIKNIGIQAQFKLDVENGKDFRDKGIISRTLHNINSWTLTQGRLINIITGFVPEKMQRWHDFFITAADEAQSAQDKMVQDRDLVIKNFTEKHNIDLDALQTDVIETVPGTTRTKIEALFYWAGRDNEKFQHTLAKKQPGKGKRKLANLQREQKAIANHPELSRNEKRLAVLLQKDMQNQYDTIAEIVARLEKFHVVRLNEGKELTDETRSKLDDVLEGYGFFVQEKAYLPMLGTRKNPTRNLLEDIADVLQIVPEDQQRVRYGSMHERGELGRKDIQTNLLGVWKQTVKTQAHFIAYSDTITNMWEVLEDGGDKSLSSKIYDKYGEQMQEAFRAYVGALARPTDHVARDGFAKLFSNVRQGAALSFLGFNLMTMAKQWPSLVYFLGTANPGHMLEVLKEATTKEGRKNIIEFAQQEPQMKSRQMEGILDELETLNNTEFESLYARVLDKVPGIQNGLKAKKKAVRALMWGIQASDKMVTSIGYNAQYRTSIQKGKSETEARRDALRAVLDSQPASNVKDVPRAWRYHPAVSSFLIFTNQLNKIYNMGMVDVFIKAVKTKKVDEEVLRKAMALAAGGLIIGTISQGFRWKDDDEETGLFKEGVDKMTAAFLASLPLAGGPIAAAYSGWPSPSNLMTTLPYNTVMGGIKLLDGEFASAGSHLSQGLLLPGQTQIRRVYQAAFDPEYDATRVFGTKPNYENTYDLIPLMERLRAAEQEERRDPLKYSKIRRKIRKLKNKIKHSRNINDKRNWEREIADLRKDLPKDALRRKIFSTLPNKWGYTRREVQQLYNSVR